MPLPQVNEAAVTEAIVLAGGLGTRLRPVVSDLPKPMAPVAGRPFLAWLLDYLELQGIRRVVLSVGYLSEAITQFFGERYGAIEITYSIEDEPLGTGGGIAGSLSLVKSAFVFVLNGDTFLKLDYRAMARLASEAGEDFVLAVALRETDDARRYGRVVLKGGRITGFEALGAEQPGPCPSMINAGVYLMNSSIFRRFEVPRRFSFEKEFLETKTAQLRPLAFPCDVPFIDIGIPEALEHAQVLLPAWLALCPGES